MKKGQFFFVRFLIPLLLAGTIFFLVWLAPAAIQVLLWTLVLLSFLNRLLCHFKNGIVLWLFLAVLFSIGIFYFLHSENIAQGVDRYSLQNKSLSENTNGISPLFSRQTANIRAEVHGFSISFLQFILPGKNQVAIIFLFVLVLQLFGLKIFHIILDKRSNSVFEFLAFIVAKVYYGLVDFFFYGLLEIAFVFSLWMLALHLLQFDYAFEIALAVGLSTLTPTVGMWLGGLFPLLYVQTSDKMTVQLVGVVITFAVIWLFRHIAIALIDREQFWDIKPGIILVLLGVGYLFGNVNGLFFIVPLFVSNRFLASTFLQGKTLYFKI